MLLIILVLISLTDSLETMLLAYGTRTPLSLKSRFNSTISLNLANTSENINYLNLGSESFILDISLDSQYFPILDSISENLNIPYLTITKIPDIQTSSKRFLILPPTRLEAESIAAMINFFQWEKFSIFLSNSEESLNILAFLKNLFNDFQLEKYIYDKNISEENLDALIKKSLKLTGVRNLLVLDRGNSLDMCVKLLKLRKMDQFGNYLLFGVDSHFSGLIEGAIGLSYEIGINDVSMEQFYIDAINYVIGNLTSFTFEAFNKFCNSGICLKKFIVINVKNGKKVEVGTFDDSLTLTDDLIFPGNNTNMKVENKKQKIPIMIANGTSEPNNFKSNKTSYTYHGALYAAKLANLDKELEEFEYVFIPTDCGNMYLDLNWSLKCLSKYTENLGIAYVTGYWDASSMGNALSLRALNKLIPQVSPSSGSDFLNNKTQYPEFLKMSGDSMVLIQNSIIMHKFFDWNDVIFLIGDGKLDKMRYTIYTSLLIKMGINIINPEAYRFLPYNYTRADFDRFKHIFEYIRDTQCRIIIFIITSPGHAIEALYDVGLRKGDLILILPLMAFYSSNQEEDEIYLKKQLEILDGALTFGYLEYQNDHGKQVEKELKKRYSPIINMCQTYDSFITISSSIKYLINKGEDYEDPNLLISSMRQSRNVGCSGDIFFSQNDNSRRRDWASYYQVLVNSTTKQYDFIQFLALSKFSVLAAREINKPVWATGEDVTPTNYRISNKCVYSKNKQRSTYGLISLHLVSIILLCVILLTVIYSLRVYDNSIPVIEVNSILSFQDMICQLYFPLEFFQILALDPPDGIITKISKNYNYFAGLNLLSFFNIQYNSYWVFQSWLTTVIFLHLFIVALMVISLKKPTKFAKYLENLIETILPFIGHVAYMPITHMLISIYQCEEGISDNLTESFLSRDCTKFCYKEDHLKYMIIITILLILFSIASTFLRPFWETVQPGLKIRTKSIYWFILTIFQLILVLVKVNLEPYNRIISGFFIAGIIFIMILITYKMKPFNYEKIFSYQLTLLTMDLWAILIGTSFFMGSSERVSIALLVTGLFVIFFIGLKKSGHYSQVFIRDDPSMISDLIKFQFGPKINREIQEITFRAICNDLDNTQLRMNHS